MRIERHDVDIRVRDRRGTALRGDHSLRPGPAKLIAPFCAAVLFALTFWALARPPGEFDGELLALFHPLDFGLFDPVLSAGRAATSIRITLLVSLLAGAVFVARRNWLETAVIAVLPVGLLACWLLAWLVGRPGPDASLTGDSGSFPSNAVAYAALFYGFLAFALSSLVAGAWLGAGRVLCLFFPVAAGVSRLWAGESWIGDVTAAYALAGLLLSFLVPAYLAIRPDLAALPLVHAAPVPHDEPEAHAHALTSTVLFHDGVVYKVYNPGFVPRFLYWLSFQSPFGYANNPVALKAAVERRNLARSLTAYWYGEGRVAPAIGVCTVDGRLAIASEYVEGGEPADHHRAREFLLDLSRRFDAAGLPTWQIDPRQPRSLGNVLESADGGLLIIDLESGMVSPLASPRAWWRAIRRARVPIYDDVYFDVTRAYVERERERMLERMGPQWLARLEEQLAEAEAASDAWHGMEPRLWSRAVRSVYSGFGLRDIRAHVEAARERGRDAAMAWLETSIDRWVEEGRYTPEAAERARSKAQDPGVQQLLPHFGVHLVIGVVLRFPFGSIARVTYTGGNLLAGTVAFLIRRASWKQLRRTLSIHSPLVLLIAAMPGVGTFSYLASGPGLGNIELLRLALDGVGERVPGHLYRRLGFRRIIARPAQQPGGAAARRVGRDVL